MGTFELLLLSENRFVIFLAVFVVSNMIYYFMTNIFYPLINMTINQEITGCLRPQGDKLFMIFPPNSPFINSITFILWVVVFGLISLMYLSTSVQHNLLLSPDLVSQI